ncbi:hypothetical protein GL325_09815 [Aeromicrobium sp. 636]|uniref:Uncharacterized protein n=1 Tax=Aeromicrobium senzhongii TaxID=2663859 RepID=A0A8I0EUS7_9ACTN|nr:MULTISPECIES: hypothetical protein [Aeromicrobium]MBC9226620.1 hypothetical protein [Aeromicrobium senzhongii]MCQ3998721.1 hypothetical protein [Aeromicrobium sp. 636]MTB89148.1 hypothetical protein [Aeromicrobium senzhongii]QNL93584.1 hypothetical protein H9L21_10725 [Aeromicrobium senzhongii]
MDDSYSPSERRGYRRIAIAGVLLLLALGLFPATAAVFDETNEGAILPVFVLLMVVVGALLWVFVPAIAGEGHRLGHRVVVGAGAGLTAAAVAALVFYALLNGYSGT